MFHNITLQEGEVDAERRNVKNADALPPGWQKHEGR